MALNVQFNKVHNYLTNEDIIVPRLVNQQQLDFNALCEYLADGSTVTAADVSAVMKQIEMRLPLVLGLNAKVVCSPEGLTFRPKVSGSLTQGQLKAKLEAKLAADPTLDIDVNREIQTSDLTVGDLTASIAIEMPKKWDERFQSKAQFKRITKTTGETAGEAAGESTDNPGSGSTVNGSGSESGNGGSADPNPVNPETPAAGGDFTIRAAANADGGGSVSIKKNGAAVAGNSVQASANDTVVIEAVPESGFQFLGWSDGNSQNPRTIQPSADMDVTASFMDLSKI
jgi:hypothetical protein